MADEDKPKEGKNLCFRRSVSPAVDQPSQPASDQVLEDNEHLAMLKQYLPYIITIIVIFFLALKVKSCVMPEKHVEVVYDYTVYNMEQLQSSLATAKNKRKPVMIEFFADWCGYCKKLEKEYLSLESVQYGLRSFVTIRMDVSDQTGEQEEIMNKFEVSGTPMLIFINKNGEFDNKVVFTSNIRNDLLNEIKKLK